MLTPITVMLVDDSAIFLGLVADFLQLDPDIRLIDIAENGETAVQKFQDLLPRVILIDMHMAGLSGLDTIPLLRAIAPDTRIILMSMLNDARTAQAALDAGADLFMTKTTLVTDLLPSIRRVCEETTSSSAYKCSEVVPSITDHHTM